MWYRSAGAWVTHFDSCQLTYIWMAYIKKQNWQVTGFSYLVGASCGHPTFQSYNMSTHFSIFRKNLKKKLKLVFYNQLTFSCQKDLYTMKLLQNKRRKLINRYSGMLQRARHRISSWSHWLLRISQIPNLIVISLFIFTVLKEIITHRRTKHRLLFYKMNTGCSWNHDLRAQTTNLTDLLVICCR